MTTPKRLPVLLLYAAALALTVTAASTPVAAARRHLRAPAGWPAVDPAVSSQMARAQAAALWAQHPDAAVAALAGF